MRFVPRWRRESDRAGDGEKKRTDEGAAQELEVIKEIASEFTTEELQEFLEADRHPIEADPAFKERLRQQLWRLLQRKLRESSGPSS
jgi:predicted HD phosphohydrolase